VHYLEEETRPIGSLWPKKILFLTPPAEKQIAKGSLRVTYRARSTIHSTGAPPPFAPLRPMLFYPLDAVRSELFVTDKNEYSNIRMNGARVSLVWLGTERNTNRLKCPADSFGGVRCGVAD
jgi:hypothetical protein